MARCCSGKLRKRKTGPAAGLYICRSCGLGQPRPQFEAYQLGIPFWLWKLIHARIVAVRGDDSEAATIRASMIAQWKAGEIAEPAPVQATVDEIDVATPTARPLRVDRESLRAAIETA